MNDITNLFKKYESAKRKLENFHRMMDIIRKYQVKQNEVVFHPRSQWEYSD